MPALASAGASAVTALVLAVANPGQVVLTLQDATIDESSGLAVSQRHDGVLWTHNDGGDTAQVLAVDATGQTVARVTLAGIDPYDPEALAPGTGPDGEPVLYLGDIGDNDRERPDVSVFRFDEPDRLTDQTVEAQWYRFTYPDGPHDAEALLVGPRGRLLVATKGISGQGLYRAPSRLVTQDQGTNRLTRIASVPSLVTDGAYLPDGRFVLRTYSAAFVYDRPGHRVAVEELPGQLQGEPVAADGDRLLIGSEGVHSEVLAVPLPGGPAPTGSGAGTGSAHPSRDPDSGVQASEGNGLSAGWPLVLVAGAVVLGAAYVLRRRR